MSRHRPALRAIVDQQSAQINHFLNLVSMASRYSVNKFSVVHDIHLGMDKSKQDCRKMIEFYRCAWCTVHFAYN